MDVKFKSNKIYKKYPKALIAVSTVVLSLIILFTTYFIISGRSDSTYKNMLYKQKLKIDSANRKVADVIKNVDQLDIKDTARLNEIIAALSDSENTIQSAIGELKQVNPPQKYKAQFDSYIQGITLNKKIFTQTSLILKNTKSNELKKAADALYEYISETTRYYEQSRNGKIYIVLPSDILTLPDRVYQYAVKAYNDYDAKIRLLEQYNIYFNSMDKILSDFQNSKTNLGTSLEQIKNGNTTLEDIYVSIENKLTELDAIDKSYNSLTVPVKIADQHEKFNSIMNMYVNYCLDYKSALNKLEEAGSDESKLLEAIGLFDELEKEYKNISDSFTGYKDKYNETKAFYTNPDNL